MGFIYWICICLQFLQEISQPTPLVFFLYSLTTSVVSVSEDLQTEQKKELLLQAEISADSLTSQCWVMQVTQWCHRSMLMADTQRSHYRGNVTSLSVTQRLTRSQHDPISLQHMHTHKHKCTTSPIPCQLNNRSIRNGELTKKPRTQIYASASFAVAWLTQSASPSDLLCQEKLFSPKSQHFSHVTVTFCSTV